MPLTYSIIVVNRAFITALTYAVCFSNAIIQSEHIAESGTKTTPPRVKIRSLDAEVTAEIHGN